MITTYLNALMIGRFKTKLVILTLVLDFGLSGIYSDPLSVHSNRHGPLKTFGRPRATVLGPLTRNTVSPRCRSVA